MRLQPDGVLFVAPRFYLAVDWADRILLADGQEWRSPAADELPMLVGDPGCSEAEALARGVCLFALPRHLLARFAAVLEQGSPDLPGFDPFAQEVGRFLAFKGLPVPPGAVLDLLICQAQTRLNIPPGGWGGVNLGDAPVSLLLPHPAGGPLVRLRLEPGEGVRLPSGAAADLAALEGGEPGVLLLVRPTR